MNLRPQKRETLARWETQSRVLQRPAKLLDPEDPDAGSEDAAMMEYFSVLSFCQHQPYVGSYEAEQVLVSGWSTIHEKNYSVVPRSRTVMR